MPPSKDMNFFDDRAWRTATLSAPLLVQLILAVLLLTMWLLGEGPFRNHDAYAGERAWMLTALAVTAVTALSASAALLRSRASYRRGLGLSMASCTVAVLVGGSIFDYLILR